MNNINNNYDQDMNNKNNNKIMNNPMTPFDLTFE